MDQALRWYRSTFGHALVGAVLLWAALPPCDLGPLAWAAPVWWVVLLRRDGLSGRKPYRTLWLVGFGFWLAALHWLRLPHWATSFGWVALSAYFACYLPGFVALGRVAVHRVHIPVILAAPVVWTGLELARAHLLTGFTMASLGHTQHRWIELIQVSDLVGAYGVSFLVMFAAACVARMLPVAASLPAAVATSPQAPTPWWRLVAWWPALLLVVVVGGALVYGYARTSGPAPEAEARIALIQGSIDIELKSDPAMRDVIQQHYLDLSRQAIREYGGHRAVDLVVWPETMFRESLVEYDPDALVMPGWLRAEFFARLERASAQSRAAIARLAGELRTSLLLGIDTEYYSRGGPRFFNSAAMIDASGEVVGRYDKMHLVMFGEYVPWADRFPVLQRFTPLSVSLTPGAEPRAFDLKTLRIAPNICYESVLPHLLRRQINALAAAGREPQVLVNLTNDGWFWGSSELDMHLICGAFRAVENRKPFLIAANTGFSAWIDADGRIRAQGPRRATGTILAEVGRDPRRSLYLGYGDWFSGACLGACGALALVGLRRRSAKGL
jgi:apolipoprotein N-acyltransferase